MCNSLVALASLSTTLFFLIFGRTVDAFPLETCHCCIGSRQPSTFSLPLRAEKVSSPQYDEGQQCGRPYPPRREFFSSMMSAMSVTAVMSSSPSVSMAASTTIFSDKNFSIEDAKSRFQAARQDLKYLLDNYTEISKSGGGDAVRNYLGTQGVSSNLYGIQKILKLLAEESEDIVEYSEAMEEFNAYYFQAEGAAYQSLFAEHSSAKATPESCLATAKQDLLQMQRFMDQLAQQLNL